MRRITRAAERLDERRRADILGLVPPAAAEPAS
jgi:hypothetical protein